MSSAFKKADINHGPSLLCHPFTFLYFVEMTKNRPDIQTWQQDNVAGIMATSKCHYSVTTAIINYYSRVSRKPNQRHYIYICDPP